MTIDDVRDFANTVRILDNPVERDRVAMHIGLLCADYCDKFDWTIWREWCKE